MTPEVLDVIVVGTGFAGLGMAINLKKAGIRDFVVLERADRVGGTWRDNTYPGLACDIPSWLYSYSFEPKTDWSRFFAPQKEILAYLEHCADRYGIRPYIRFGAEVASASFDDGRGVWRVQTTDGTAWESRVLVSGSGHALSKPVYPDLPNRGAFQGLSLHSARWDNGYAFEGKRVAVIGTGASAIQLVPQLASRAAKLYVYQRTPSWILPKPDREIGPWEQSWLRRIPAIQRVVRWMIYGVLEAYATGYVVEPKLNAVREWHSRQYLKKCVADPALRAKLTPNFRLGCKRILITNDFYPALQRENVELVTEPIDTVLPNGLRTADGVVREVDAIAYATGYVTAEARPPFEIIGRGGRRLGAEWTDGAQAYMGTTAHGYPNLYFLIGPNLGLGHNSMVFMMESQFTYILDAVRTLRKTGARFLDVRESTQSDYNEWLQKRLRRTVWNTGGCRSWYLTASGGNTTAWPGFTFEFWARTRRFDLENYEQG